MAKESVRESGHIIPQVEAVTQLFESDYLQKLYAEEFRDTEALRKVSDAIKEALAGNEDAIPMMPHVCGDCGYPTLEKVADRCPQCGSHNHTRRKPAQAVCYRQRGPLFALYYKVI